MNTVDRIIEWLSGPNTGLSSKHMAYCAMGVEKRSILPGYHPVDPADLNRCFLLVEKVPEVLNYFDKIAEFSPQWRVIIENWDELKKLFISEVGWNWTNGHEAPKTYKRMQELFNPKTKPEITIVVQIGNSDNKLTQKEWKSFINEVRNALSSNVTEIHFDGGSSYDSAFQNACFVATIEEQDRQPLLKLLKDLKSEYVQDSIAITSGKTEMV